MSELVIKFPDEASKQEGIQAYAARLGYRKQIREQQADKSMKVTTNPLTEEQFVTERIGLMIKEAIITARTGQRQLLIVDQVADELKDLRIG